MKIPSLENHPRKYILLTIIICYIIFKLYVLNAENTDDDALPDPPINVILPMQQVEQYYDYYEN
jgi:hypothetical protein